MAYRRNPMPTHGALFVTNPRRRSNGRMNLMVAGELGYGGGKKAASKAAKLKSRVGKTKKKATADERKYAAAYKSAGGNTRRAALKASAPARRGRIRAWKKIYKVKDRSSAKARRDFEAFVIRGKLPKSVSKSKPKPRRSSAAKTSWNEFRSAHKGQGHTREELSDMYKRKSNPRRRRNGLALKTNPRRRRNVPHGGLVGNPRRRRRNGLALKKNRATRRRNSANARKAMKLYHSKANGSPRTLRAAWKIVNGKKSNPRRRKNGLALKTNPRRRNGTKKGMRRKTARKAYMKKRRNTARRRNTGFGALALKTNPAMKTGIMPIDALTKAIGMVPVIGKPVAPFAAPILVGTASGVALYFVAEKTEEMLPDMLQPYALPLMGVAGAVVTLAQPFGTKKTKSIMAAAMATVAGGIYAWQMMSERSVAKAAGSIDASEDMMMADASGDMGALAMMQNPGYGAWDYTGGALNNPGYGAYEYTGSGALNNPGHASEYSDAHYGDAHYSGDDFDSHEGHALMKGRGMWYKIFGRPGRRMYNRNQSGHASSHAGKHGHRWGWLIKLVGFEGARKLAAMPPAQRIAAIKQLKGFARQKLRELMNPSLALNAVPDAPSVYEEMGPSGAHGYGAFMYQGGDL